MPRLSGAEVRRTALVPSVVAAAARRARRQRPRKHRRTGHAREPCGGARGSPLLDSRAGQLLELRRHCAAAYDMLRSLRSSRPRSRRPELNRTRTLRRITTSSNRNGLAFSRTLQLLVARLFGDGAEIRLLTPLGKKIVYSDTRCLDGDLQSTFDACAPTCEIYPWVRPVRLQHDSNRAWGEFRNSVTD
jgi:hypothetical protein